MRFSELKPGNRFLVHDGYGWGDFLNGSVYLILSIGPVDGDNTLIKCSTLSSTNGIVSSRFWMDSDVDRNKVYGGSKHHWELIG